MSKIEVEHRGLISSKEFEKLKSFFTKEGKFLGQKKRFSMILNTSHKTVREVKDDPVDLKIRVTNGQAEVAFKYGKWSGKDARKEFNFDFETEKFADFMEFLKLIGFSKFVLMANTKYDYLYRGVVFSLVEVPNWGHYFEAEILTDENNVVKADQIINSGLKKLGLKILDEEGFYDLLDGFNNREGYRVDLNKTPFSEIKDRFIEYFSK